MRKIRSKKNCINIRKGFRFFSCLSIVLALSILLGGNLGSAQKVQAAESGNPAFKMSLEDYLNKSTTLHNWNYYSNTKNMPRARRLEMFAAYYSTQLNSDVAASYGWPTITKYNDSEKDVDHNDTTADSGYDLYLLEFSTSNNVTKKDIDIYYSVYFIENRIMRYTDAVELSKDSRDFLGRDDRDEELRQGELEMTTIQIPQGAVPVGIFVWQEGQNDDKYAWDLSYLNMYKIDSISDIHSPVAESYTSSYDILDVQHNYRTFTGTRVGYIDSQSIQKKYMASTDGGNSIIDGEYFEWLYPLTPVQEEVTGYVLEVVTQNSPGITDYDAYSEGFRGAYVTLNYKLKNGNTGSKKVTIDFISFLNSHPYRSPVDYDYKYDFDYGSDYVNPIAQNYYTDEVIQTFSVSNVSFPDNNKPLKKSYDMSDAEFWTLPQNHDYNFTQINQFSAMMLGNYFDAYTMTTSYLKGYQAIQIPIVLPADVTEFTMISSKPITAYNNRLGTDPNKGVGIQSIRVIDLSEPLYENSSMLTTNGFFSPEAVLGLRGSVIAETQGTVNNYQGTWAPDNPTYKLVNYNEKNSIKVDTISGDFQGVTVTFSDTFGAGIDNLLADVIKDYPKINSADFPTNQAMIYVMKNKNNPDNLGLPLINLLGAYYRDPLTLTVTYYDSFGETREVDIPFVTAYLTQLIMDSRRIGDVAPETWISGVFQQGQTVGLRLNLSEFKSLVSVKLSYGYDENPLTGRLRSMEGDAWYDDDDDERLPLTYSLAKDSIAIDSICFYDDVTTANFYARYKGTDLTSTIETTLKPSSSWQASTANGQIITADRSFTAYKESKEGATVNMIDGAPIRDEYKDKYLIEISTLDTPIAGTISNLSYQIHYTDTYGTSRSTTVGSLQGAAKDFYGNSSRNLDIFATDFQSKVQTSMHLTGGSKFCFVTELSNVQQFDGITLSTDGADEWQPEQIRILKLTSLSERTATRDTAFLGNLSALDIPNNMKDSIAKNLGIPTYRWDRTYTGTVMATATPNLLLHSGKTSARVNFTVHNTDGTTVAPDTELEEVKYLEKIPNTMTYEDTLMDLGLNIVKNTYQVHVDVANIADAGSSNYFYFQLLFENGRSGLVLANQQLPADSFRQGVTETFEIQTTQRYGELKAVRIICEATASTANAFDKLNINKITVTLNSQQGTGKSWIVDRVGWVDINYVDEIQQSYASDDNVILENTDLTLDFPVTSISSSTDLLFCLTTGKQPSSSASSLNMTSLGDKVEGILTYTDFQNTTRTINIDIPQKIMDFNENESTSRIFRSGTMDRFLVSLSDVKQIDSFVITRNEGKNADWIIADISVQKVGGVGDVYLSAYTGEYIRNIEYSEYLTKSTSQNVALGLNDSKTFHFEAHTIEADISSEDNNAWNSTITRYPITSDESLNIYIYLTNASGEPYKLSAGDHVDASIIYSSSQGTGALKAGFKNIRAQATTESSSMLYAQALPIQSVGSLKSMELRGNFSGTLKPLVRCVYIEHVQGNVIKDTLYVPFNNASLALDKVSANISSSEALTPMKQIVRLQPEEGTTSLLTPESSDIAVALRFTSSLDPETTKMVYQSPYVFLTDVDYTILDNRNHIEVPFYLNGVGEIVGLTVISSGPTVKFENALITNYPKPSTTDGVENEVTTLLGSCSIAESFVSTNIISKMMKTSKDVTPVTFTFTTPKEDLVAGCGTSGQVGMLITYTDSANKQQTYRITNILDYLPLDNPPFPDTVTSFNILMTDVAYLNSITLTPTSDDWFLSEVNAKVTTYDNAKQTTVNKTAIVNQWAKSGGPLTIDMRPDSVNTDGPIINKITGFSISASAQQSKVSSAASSGNPLNIKVVAGDVISFTPTFQMVGTPTANVNWTAYKYEKFFTDYNDGSATFAVPTEDMITNDGLPKQYTLSAVCSENNSLAIPITIDVVSQEDLDQAKDNTAKLTLVTQQGDKTISTATYNESTNIKLEVPAVALPSDNKADGLKTKEITTFKFIPSLDKDTALFNVNDSQGLIVADSNGAYTLTVPAGLTKEGCKDYYLMFNVADSETETTYSITVSVSLVAEDQEAKKVTVELKTPSNTVASGSFEENSVTNAITYSRASVGDIISYNLPNLPIGAEVKVTPISSSYADEVAGNTTPITGITGTLLTVPSLIDLNNIDGVSIPSGSTVSFSYDVTVTKTEVKDGAGNVTTPAINFTGQININVTYSNDLSMTLNTSSGILGTNILTSNNGTYNYRYNASNTDTTVTMDLSSSSVTGAKLEAGNDYASKATISQAEWSNTSSGTPISFTVPAYNGIMSSLSETEKADYDDGKVTVDYVFKLIETDPTDGGMENTITISVTYTNPTPTTPPASGTSFSLRRPVATAPVTEAEPISTEETSLTTSAGVGDILN